MNKKASTGTVKTVTIWTFAGLATMGALCFVAAAVAMKAPDPLQTVRVCALVSVFLGFALSAFGAVRSKRALWAGFACGGVLLAVLVFLSLWGENEPRASLLPYICAAVGATVGAFAAKGRKASTAKRVKALTKRSHRQSIGQKA